MERVFCVVRGGAGVIKLENGGVEGMAGDLRGGHSDSFRGVCDVC